MSLTVKRGAEDAGEAEKKKPRLEVGNIIIIMFFPIEP